VKVRAKDPETATELLKVSARVWVLELVKAAKEETALR
jgi:hypothetical protein